MGAEVFESYAQGATAAEAFHNAVNEAQYLHGHGGYTGTIAEKSSFVLIDFLGVAPEHFGLYFACMVAGYVVGNLAAIRLGRKLVPDQILVRGLVIAVAGGSLMAGLSLSGVYSVWAVILPQTLFMVGTVGVPPPDHSTTSGKAASNRCRSASNASSTARHSPPLVA